MDAQQLIEHLRQTPAFIKRHRSRMIPGGIGYSDAPTFGGFSSKSPCSDHAMELGDAEAAFIGNLAYYCMRLGSIPRHHLRGLWFVNHECKGLGVVDWESDVEPIYPLINHLIQHAEDIVNTEGVDDLLRAGEETRWYSRKMFPNESEEWVSEAAAKRITGTSLRTLQRWREAGTIRFIKDNNGVDYYKKDLELMMEIKRSNMLRGVKA